MAAKKLSGVFHGKVELGVGSVLLTKGGRRRLLGPNEKQVEHAGDRLMDLYGFEAVRFSQARATQQTRGIPDRRYYHRERRIAVWWEAKRTGGKQRPEQRQFQEMVEAVGESYVVGDVDALGRWLGSQVELRGLLRP